MINRLILFVSIIAILTNGGCVKDTYNMKLLSKKAHLSPTFALSAVKGNITLDDIVKQNDNVVFGEDNFVKIIFKIDSVFDFTIDDFIISKSMVDSKGKDPAQLDSKTSEPAFNYAKAVIGQLTATIDPDSIDLDIKEILSNITGTFTVSNPSIKINYTNSFTDSIDLILNVTGHREDNIVDLDLDPFAFLHPLAPTDPEVTSSFKVDRSNSSLPELISMLPEKIYFSGAANLYILGKSSLQDTYLLGDERLFGNLEVEIPLEFRIDSLQFTKTVDNFMIDENSGSDNPIKPENFDLLRIDIRAKNGFPLGASVSMELYDSVRDLILNKVEANELLMPAPVDNNGRVKSDEVTEASTSIEFTKEFFSSINKADKIIFRFTLNTTDSNLDKDVKIYSDYSIDFDASLVVKPDIIVDLK